MNKLIIAVVIILILIVISYFIVKNFKKGKGSREESRETAKELRQLNKNPATKQTITPQQAATMANNIFAAMDGYGTDATTIFKNLLALKNEADFLALSDAFGVREVSSGRGNPAPNFKGTLSAALTDELGATDAGSVAKLNAIFKQRKISLVI